MKKRKARIMVIIFLVIIIITMYYVADLIQNKKTVTYSDLMVNEQENIQPVHTIEEENVMNQNNIKVYITGAVQKAGVIELTYGARIVDAIEKAGGTTDKADLSKVNLAYCLEDGQKLYIPCEGERVEEYITLENEEGIIEVTDSSDTNSKININKATEEQLQAIPGVGPAMAQKIVQYRKEKGDFKSIEDIKNVSGIGDKKFEGLKQYIIIK